MRARLLLVAVGAGMAFSGLPAVASSGPSASVRSEQDALELLETAARAGRSLTYSGTQYLATWHGEDSGSALVEVSHDALHGSVVSPPPVTGEDAMPMTVTAALDPRLLRLLAASYDLVVAAPGRCTGRSAHVVEARRPQGSVAGRFWIDRDSGLLLRREVFDEQDRRIRSSAFLDLEVRDGETSVVEASEDGLESVEQLRSDGWRVPEDLPGGLRLFDVQLTSPAQDEHVLHLAYSDGLSTVSLFAQKGRLGSEQPAGFAEEEVGDRPVWVRHETPERVVWGGEGRVWTLVSDAPAATVLAAVGALPRDQAPRDGLLARLGRGLARMAGMLNPFD